MEEVRHFHLGSGGIEKDIKSRIVKARGIFVTLNKIWKDKTISQNTKFRIFNSNVKFVLYNGCETWKTIVSCIKKLQTFVN